MKIPQSIINKLKRANALNTEVKKLSDEIFYYFANNNIDLTKYEGGCNSANAEEMMSCYIDYGEDSLETLISNIENEYLVWPQD
jgi:hypothetical protein